MDDLPACPKVKTWNDLVIIEYDNGEKIVWGRENSVSRAVKVAKKLEFELKLLQYIEELFNKYLETIQVNMEQYNDDKLVNELIKEVLWSKIRP